MPRKLHGLKRPKFRQDWSKENLYNLSRLSTPSANNKTFFQQKWAAKSAARGYHNPYVREGTWTRMFSRRLPAVVPMDHAYLAAHDGSEMAEGRGSGAEKASSDTGAGARGGRTRDAASSGRADKTPYMHMTFHPLERRLDTAIWRALFASSVNQARQFVVHGWVKVNGKRMIYPGYQLNPGDMFQVEPDRVLYATGARKFKAELPGTRAEVEKGGEAVFDTDDGQDLQGENQEEAFHTQESEAEPEPAELHTQPEDGQEGKRALKDLMVRAEHILDDSKRTLSGKRQQDLRAFVQTIRKTMSKYGGSKSADMPTDAIKELELALAEITTKIPEDAQPRALDVSPQRAQDADAAASATAETPPPSQPPTSNPQILRDPSKLAELAARKESKLLDAALERARANPVDATKPYATPWAPREFMSAFAFIPRYLEVNQRVCSAVYLRHPVARPGIAEAPTPFSAETMELAFNWYLRRR